MILRPGSELDGMIERDLRGEASPRERKRLAAWRAESAENERYYRRMERMLRVAQGLRPRGGVPPRPGAGEIIAAAEARRRGGGTSRPGRGWIPWGVAAAALLVAGFGLLGGDDAPAWAPAEVVTGAGELATVQLGDGTVVRLAPSSRLRVDAERPREVTLDGRAFFAVTRMPDRPFRVHAGDATADVLGTRFELATDSGRVQLRVVEGRVALGTAINTVEVGAGEESGVRSGTALLPTRPEGGTEAPAWLGAFLVFQATPLRDAAGEIERAFDVRVLVEDEALADATLTSSFTDQPLEGVIDVVCAVLDARCGIQGGVVSIGR